MKSNLHKEKMDNKEFIEKIRDLIAEGETEQSLDELYQFVRSADNELLDRLELLRNRMRKLQRDVQSGVLDDDDEYQERAKINEALLGFLRQMTPEYMGLNAKEEEKNTPIPPTHEPRRPAPAPVRDMKPYYIAGGVVVLLVILFFMFRGSSNGGDNITSVPVNSFSSNDAYPKWGEVKTKDQDDLRIRTRPDENSGIVVNMPHGSKVKVIGADETYVRLSNGDYGKWMKVEYNDGNGREYVGWAWGGYITLTQ